MIKRFNVFLMLLVFHSIAMANNALEKTTRIGKLEWDLHEVTVGSVRIFAKATQFISQAEREGGGYIYEMGWQQKSGWNWHSPYGKPAKDNEPAAYLTFAEAQSICRFFGKRLPTDTEWTNAAFLEQRHQTNGPFKQGTRYPYPHGEKADGSHHLNGQYVGLAPRASITRGTGHVPVMTTEPGVNGLFDMGGNLWEWVDTSIGREKMTRGASWWYGPERQKEDDVASKSVDTRVAYLGFRCVKDLK